MKRAYNFSPGPSALPLPVLEKAASELVNYGDAGMSVMEMSHRSADFEPIIEKAEADLRTLMGIPENFRVMFLQGGATTQFAAVPMNLIQRSASRKALYAVSGQFSGKAFSEAQRMGYDARCIASTKDINFVRVPEITADMIDQDASYLHICQNNTIYGTKFPSLPDTGTVPLVADLSSCILSEPYDINNYAVIYAGAQKNMAPAGMTLVVARSDMLEYAEEHTPTMLHWKTMAEAGSMHNTPPCYAIYMAGLVFEWLLSIGGLEEMAKRNHKKADYLYSYLDSQNYYIAPVEKTSRSMMNVTFVTGNADLDKKFAAEAEAYGIKNIKGHRSVGGMRASIYNAMPYEGVETLVQYMERFAKENPKN